MCHNFPRVSHRYFQLADNVELINMLLDAGADINGYGDEKLTPLILALWRRDLPTVQLLLGKSWHFNFTGNGLYLFSDNFRERS